MNELIFFGIEFVTVLAIFIIFGLVFYWTPPKVQDRAWYAFVGILFLVGAIEAAGYLLAFLGVSP